MDLKERNQKIRDYHKEQMDILERKGSDYNGGRGESVNVHHSHIEAARRLSGAPITPVTIWYTMMTKHLMAIETFIKTGNIESEGLEGRLNDIANYANIGRSMLETGLFEQHTNTCAFNQYKKESLELVALEEELDKAEKQAKRASQMVEDYVRKVREEEICQ